MQSAADLARVERERDELRQRLDDLRIQMDQEIEDMRQQRDLATKHSNELLLEKESWKQDAKSSKALVSAPCLS